VVRLLAAPAPPGVSAIQWLNSPANPGGVYAEDPFWWIGVSVFFDELQQWPGMLPDPGGETQATAPGSLSARGWTSFGRLQAATLSVCLSWVRGG